MLHGNVQQEGKLPAAVGGEVRTGKLFWTNGRGEMP
nr:MAG TPA: hypothetical protein [Caudoviricetes sp.]